jgi:hypothetical protein
VDDSVSDVAVAGIGDMESLKVVPEVDAVDMGTFLVRVNTGRWVTMCSSRFMLLSSAEFPVLSIQALPENISYDDSFSDQVINMVFYLPYCILELLLNQYLPENEGSIIGD